MKTKRQIIEEEFHDQLARNVQAEDLNIFDSFSLGAQENRYAHKLFGDLKGKRVLDLGCGFGETAVFWATQGADVVGVDISKNSLKLAEILAEKNGVSLKCKFKQMVAEDLQFEDSSFDLIFGNGILHHSEIEKVLVEVKRVLKSGGTAVFIEPLVYNPVIWIYRKIADKVRTPYERPLTFKIIKKMHKYFSSVSHSEYQLTTQAIFFWFFLVERINPNKERYWKKLYHLSSGLKKVLKVLIFLDKVILTIVPLRFLCWNTVIVLKK